MIRQMIFSGPLFDAGVKKLDMAFLVVVDSTLRLFRRGGETDASLVSASLLFA